MTIVLNGSERDVRDGMTVEELLSSLGAEPGGIAVACNDAVVRRSAFAEHRIKAGDRVEIIKAVAGG